ncbi:epidermal growth factor receptor kinase substrate 8-like protein 3 isoform X2 [Mixophyes fleayi]
MDEYLNAIDGVLEQHGEPSRPRNISNRPSAKNIYQQRKQYAQALSKPESNFHHRVEHLSTCDLGNGLKNVDDCLKHLWMLDAEGKVWGQELILQVQNGELLLTDLESRDSLETVSLENIESCNSVMGRHPYKSILTITVQNQRNTSVLLFQCDEQPANVLHKNLEKALTQWEENHPSKNNMRNKLQNFPVQNDVSEPGYLPQQRAAMESPILSHSSRDSPQDSPILQRRFEPKPISVRPPSHTQSHNSDQMAETERDIEVLNHTLADIEIFADKLNSDKKKKRGKSTIPEAEFTDCFQKIKYSFNLLAKVKDQMYEPSAVELIHMMMNFLPRILSKCPGKNTASDVLSPFLTQKALTLLSSCVTDKERQLWTSLGEGWLRTRADWPNGNMVPSYTPTFYDGWIAPDTVPRSQPEIQQNSLTPPTNRHFQPVHMKVLYDFEARNDRELSVKKGDSVKVLDQSRQWWMVENAQERTGFVPNNIMESTNNDQVSVHFSSLHPGSKPQEVTAWLQDKGFSRITVRCLGVLSGDQLLNLTREDIKGVCPEEGGRVFNQLTEIRASLGM